jgi:ubiquinone/menaquinone biosynthesis C-methylase UbiE
MNHPESLKSQQEESHKNSYSEIVKKDKSKSYLSIDNTRGWARNYPFYQLETFFRNLPKSEFLTVGDGKGGHEAQILKRFGHRATGTDIATDILEVAKQENLIDEFFKEDAEKLSFKDSSFDFSVIKESLHHLPRPYLCIYEMLRVSRKGIMLVEPNGDRSYQIGNEQYESGGNYKYQFTLKELVQCAASLGYNNVAYGYAPNVNYILNCFCFRTEFPEQWAHKETRPTPQELVGQLLPCSLKYGTDFHAAKEDFQKAVDQWYGSHEKDINPLLVFMIFKEKLDENLQQLLQMCHMKLPEVKPNPYLTK